MLSDDFDSITSIVYFTPSTTLLYGKSICEYQHPGLLQSVPMYINQAANDYYTTLTPLPDLSAKF